LSAVVLPVALLTGSEAAFAAQAVVFAVGAFLGLRYAPFHSLYRTRQPGSARVPRCSPVRRRQALIRPTPPTVISVRTQSLGSTIA
jgi:hypothetical protein